MIAPELYAFNPSKQRVVHDGWFHVQGGEALAGNAKSGRNSGKVRTVVFDLGGVLFTEGKSVALEVLSRDFGYDRKIVSDVLTCKQSRDLRKGLLPEMTFWSWVGDRLPQGYDAQVIRDEWYKGYILDTHIFELVKRVEGHYRLVVFSENIRERVAYLDKQYRFRDHFDDEIYSYDHHVGKRDPEFLEALLVTLGEPPNEMLYIDNCKTPLEMAERLGIKVVQYTTGRTESIEEVMRCLNIPSEAAPPPLEHCLARSAV